MFETLRLDSHKYKFILKKLSVEGFVYRTNGEEELRALFSCNDIVFLDFSNNRYVDPVSLTYAIRIFVRLLLKSSKINRRLVSEIETAKFSLKKIVRLLRLSYVIGFIERHHFKFGLTFVDDCPLFHLLSMYFEGKVNLIAIQNGNRFYPSVFANPMASKGWFGGCSCYLQVLISFSKYELSLYNESKFYARKIYPLGSLRASFWKKNHRHLLDNFLPGEGYDVCVAMTSGFNYKSNIRLATYIQRLSLGEKKICVCLSFASKSEGANQQLQSIKNYFGDRVTYFHSDEKRCYEISQVSKITISAFSSVLREVLEMGCKVYPLNFDGPDFNGVYGEFSKAGLILNPTFKRFVKTIDSLTLMTMAEYNNKFESVIRLISAKSNWGSYKKGILRALINNQNE